MKKRLLIVLCLALLLGIAIGIGATVSAETADFQVGYAIVDITPRDASGVVLTDIPLSGFGNTLDRRSTDGLLDEAKGDAYNLSATCIAMSDQNGNPLLLITTDLSGANSTLFNQAKNRICEQIGVPVDHIMMSGTHTHSAPDLSQTSVASVVNYRTELVDKLVEVAVAAWEDLAPIADMKIGSVAAYANGDSLNGIRHYVNPDGTYTGDNFGTEKTGLKQITEIDDKMHLLQFTFADKDPIVLANWRAHATTVSAYEVGNGREYFNYLSADYIASFRANMSGYRFAFFQGAAGNVNPRSKEANAPYTKATMYGNYGAILATCAKDGLANNMSSVPAGTIKTTHNELVAEQRWEEGESYGTDYMFAPGETVSTALTTMYNRMYSSSNSEGREAFEKYGVNISDGVTMLEAAVIIKNAYYGDYLNNNNAKEKPDGTNDGSDGMVSGYGKNADGVTVINSAYHASNMIDLYDKYLSGSYKGTLELNAITIGDHISLVTAPGELFDTRNYTYSADPTVAAERHSLVVEDVFEQDDEAGNAVKRVFLLGYANASQGYFPSYYTNGGDTSDAVYAEHEGYGGYETNVTNYKFGTYELVQKTFIDMLTSLQKGCECGGAAEGIGGHVCFDASWQDWSSADSLPTVSGYYTLTGDVTLNEALTVDTDAEIHLDLNGHTVTVKGEAAYQLNNEDALLTVADTGVGGKLLCTATTEGAITVTQGTVKLYGGTLDGNNAGRPVNVTGGQFLVYGGIITGGKTTENGGNIYVAQKSKVTLYSGTVSAGHAYCGGNIYVADGGKVIQQGGTVTGGYADQGTANKYGGNLYIAAGSEYVLEDGAVSDGNSSYYGGNVYIYNGGTMNIQGGTVTGGNATSAAGNIYVDGTLQMSGGTVTEGKVDDQATAANANILLSGTAQFDMTGGTVTGGVECSFTPVVKLSGAPVILDANGVGITLGSWANQDLVFDATGLTSGARIGIKFNSVSTTRVFAKVSKAADAGFFVSGNDGYTVIANEENGLVLTSGRYGCVCMGTAIGVGDHVCDTTTAWQDWTSADSLPTTTGKYRLTEKVTLSETQTIAGDQHVCLDLNGFTVSGNGSRVYRLYSSSATDPSSSLAITDSSVAKTGTVIITGAYGSDQGGVIWAANGNVSLFGGTLDATSVKKADNTNPKSGPVIYIKDGYSFTMYGGKLLGTQEKHSTDGYNNTLKDVYGGAVYAADGASFTMYGGSIVSGKAKYGGAVYGGTSAQIKLYGGTIYGGESTNGGALYLYGSDVLLDGTLITDGSTTNNGGNVYIDGGSFLMEGGEIAGGQTLGYNGGNIYITGTTEMTMNGGTIRDGVAYSRADSTSSTGSTGGLGGNLYIDSNVTLNLKDGTITGGKTDKLEDSPVCNNGGNICLSGTLNMTGGEISHGYAGNCGGNMVLYGKLYMSGGKMISGSSGSSGTNIFAYHADDVRISGDALIDGGFYVHSGESKTITVSGSATVCPGETQSSNYGFRLPGYTYNSETGADDPAKYSDNSIVKADYLIFENLESDAKVTVYMTMGELSATDRHFALLSGTNADILKSVSYYTDAAKVVVDGETLYLDFADPVMIGDTGYASLEAALAAYDFASDQEIKLMADLAEHVTIDQSVKLDMNGHYLYGRITGKTGDEVLYGMDSTNNHYDASACGKLMADLENVTVATQFRYVDSVSSVVRHYVALDDLNGDYTFHRVYIKITTAMLRPDHVYEGAISPGLYFKSTMAGDEAVVSRLAYYGVAAAKNSQPTALEERKYSKFPAGTAFQPGVAVVSNGTMVTGIMTYTGSYDEDPVQPLEQNLRNAAVDIYGRPYMVLLDAAGNEMDPIFGDSSSMNLRQAVETADAKYSTLNSAAKTALDKLYAAFPREVATWNIDESRIPVVSDDVITLPCDTPVFQIDVDTDILS